MPPQGCGAPQGLAAFPITPCLGQPRRWGACWEWGCAADPGKCPCWGGGCVRCCHGCAPPPPPKAATASPLTQMGFLPMPPQSSRQVPVASCLITKAKTIGLWLLCSELSPKKQG